MLYCESKFRLYNKRETQIAKAIYGKNIGFLFV